MDRPQFFKYVEDVLSPAADDPVPTFCSNGCMINFVAIKSGTLRPVVELDYQRYREQQGPLRIVEEKLFEIKETE